MEINLLKEIEKSGGKVEPIKKSCKFQTVFAENIFAYCEQTKNRDYSFNLGSAGGPAICCEGAPPQIVNWKGEVGRDGNVIHTPIYGKKPKPCLHYIKDSEVIGYKIILPFKEVKE